MSLTAGARLGFLVIKFPQNDKSASAPTLNVVLNWTDERERLMSAKQ